jgi:ParB family chromosome partitioning protein
MSLAHQIMPVANVDRVEHTPPSGVRWHPYADIFPWIEGPAFKELVEDVRQNGVLEPIVFLDGAILDGRNRYMAAREAGVEYPRVEYTGDDPLGFVISHNLTRRHLDAGQRAMVASRIAKLPRGRPSGNTEISAIVPTQEQAARLMNVSTDSIQFARKVEENGAPELIAAVDAGEASISAAALVATLPKEEQAEIASMGGKAVADAAREIREGKHVRGTFGTGENEWYTPEQHIELARQVLGTIELDPASSHVANQTVKAERFFSQETNGLEKEWAGNVWLNPPYAQPAIAQFADKMVAEWQSGRVTAAIVLTHNYTDTAWFQTLARAAAAICFTRGRVRFVSPAGELAAPTQGQAFFYFGPETDIFADVFGQIGFVAEVRQ